MSDLVAEDPEMAGLVAQAKQLQPSAPTVTAPPDQQSQNASAQDPEMAGLAAQAKELQPQVSSSKQTIEPIAGLQGFINNIGKQLGTGTDELGSDVKAFTNLGLGNQSYEDFAEEDTAYKALQKAMHPEDDINTSVHDNLNQALEPFGTTLGNAMIQSVPQLGATGVGMAVGGLAAFTIGAPVTVPVLIGGATVAAVIGVGGMVKSLREHGADPNIARVGGLLAGAANAATMFIGGAGGAKVAETVVEEGTRAVVKQMAKTTGINAIAMELNSLADIGVKLASNKYTSEERQKELLNGIATTLVAAPTLGIGGALLGKALKPMATASENINALTAKFNKILETRKAERFEKMRAEMFPEAVKVEEATKKLEGKVEKNVHAELLKNKLKEETAKFNQSEQEYKTQLEAIKEERKVLIEQITSLNKEKAVLLKELDKTHEVINGKLTAIDPELNKSRTQAKLAEIDQVIDEKTNQFSRTEIPQNKANREAINKTASELKAVHETQLQKKNNLENDRKYAQQYNKKLEDEKAIKALEEAEKQNKKLQEEGYIQDTVDEAVLTAQLAQNAAKNLVKGKPIFQSNKKLVGGIKAFWERYSPWSRISGYATVSPAGKHRIIFQDHPNADPIIEKLDTFHAVQAYDTLKRQNNERYYGHLEASTGLNHDELNWLMFKAPSDELVIDYIGADGKSVHEEISADQAISYLSLMKNKDALAALTDAETGNNMTVDTPKLPGKLTTEKVYRDALEAANPAYLNVLEGRANFYAEMGPELAGLVKKNEPGREFNLQENYGITIRRRGAVETPTTDYTPVAPGGDYTNPVEGLPNKAPGFINERGASKTAIEVDGCFQADMKRCRQQARYQAMWEPAKLWNALKGSAEFKQAVEIKFRNGKMLYNSTMSSYEDAVHGAAKAEDGWDKFVNLYLKAKSVHVLGFQPTYIPKHIATFYNFTLYKYKGKFIPPDALLKGAKSALAHPKAAANLVLGWEDIKTRYADINQLAAITNDEAENPTFTKFRRGSTIPLRIGDQGAVIMGGKAVYDYVFELTGNAKTAEKEAVKAVNEVLASGSRSQISSMARHPLGKIFANLHQPQMRLAQHALEAQRLAVNHPTKENVANAVRVTAINHIASGLFSLPSVAVAGVGAVITGNATGLSESAYQAYSNFMTGAMFPIGDSATKAAFTEANNYAWDDKHKVWELSAGPLESLHKFYLFGSDVVGLASGSKEANFDSVFRTAMHGIQGPGSVVPIPEWPIKTVGQGVSETQ